MNKYLKSSENASFKELLSFPSFITFRALKFAVYTIKYSFEDEISFQCSQWHVHYIIKRHTSYDFLKS